MSTRPILDARPGGGSASPIATAPSTTKYDSPLARQLPGWDLVPAHTLLVRRRPVRVVSPANTQQG